METRTRNLRRQIMIAVTENEGTPLTRPEAFVMEVTGIDPDGKGMAAIQGAEVARGQISVPIRSGIYLARTFHHRGDQDVAIYNICVMDAAGAIRLLLDIREDTRTPGFAQRLRTPITDLIDEHAQLNHTNLSADYQAMSAIESFINLIGYWKPERWTRWVAYLLEKLRPHTDLASYEGFLEQVGDAIATRMVTGLW